MLSRSSDSVSCARLIRIGLCSFFVTLFACFNTPHKVSASIVRDAENGIHYYCSDGRSFVIATAKGLNVGLSGDGLSFPFGEGNWSPMPGRFGCYYRGMSAATQQSLLKAVYYYCVQVRRNCY